MEVCEDNDPSNEVPVTVPMETDSPYYHQHQPSRSELIEPPGMARPVCPGGSPEDLLGFHKHNHHHTKTENTLKIKTVNLTVENPSPKLMNGQQKILKR